MSDNLAGHLLIALPSMRDPRFDRAAILLCEHGSGGAMGLVVNKPAVDVSFSEIAEQLDLPVAGTGGVPVRVGGPCETERGFLLHAGPPVQGGQAVSRELSMCATVDLLRAVAAGEGPEPCVLLLGYAGWGPGQLEDELAQNVWLTTPADPALVLSDDPGGVWATGLRGLGAAPGVLSGHSGQA
ncbi:putative transcriptional regulator [Hasllibacter halocynthiae]|uniref:UPF0301 protein BCF33_2490 n=1 Tax=Hasllibacter halocynthiae TaxID=595589 RepID=A0A2T0X3V1_9RHOB|nr:YqgE/AlgH family protein [Hasllibacter halocynthiae]PRY93610.1 putative transcriptional regulator [Hasllibacter halocynthiae]